MLTKQKSKKKNTHTQTHTVREISDVTHKTFFVFTFFFNQNNIYSTKYESQITRNLQHIFKMYCEKYDMT